MNKEAWFIVVENAGYEGECDQRSFASRDAAEQHIARSYGTDEIDRLHVAVRLDRPDGSSTYELN